MEKEVRDLSFLLVGGYSDAYSAVPQNIKLSPRDTCPQVKGNPHPHPEHGKWIFFFSTEGSHRILRIHQWGQRILRSPGEPHNGMSLPCQIIPMETAKLAWQANNHSKLRGRPLPANCPKVKNTPALGTSGHSHEETSQKPFISLPPQSFTKMKNPGDVTR